MRFFVLLGIGVDGIDYRFGCAPRSVMRGGFDGNGIRAKWSVMLMSVGLGAGELSMCCL